MTVPKRFEPVRQACAHYPDFCPRNALEGSDRCEVHRQRVVMAAASPPAPAAKAPAVPPGAIASPEAYDLAALMIGDVDGDAVDFGDDLGRDLLRRRRPYANTKPKPKPLIQQLLPFGLAASTVLQAMPQRPFTPRGLMLWNAGALNVEATYVGNREQLLCAWGKVPAAWWSTQRSFEEVCKALEAGQEAASWGTWDSAQPGVTVRLQFDGDCSDVKAVMWGHSVSW